MANTRQPVVFSAAIGPRLSRNVLPHFAAAPLTWAEIIAKKLDYEHKKIVVDYGPYAVEADDLLVVHQGPITPEPARNRTSPILERQDWCQEGLRAD